jgi:hypothetical protein
MTANASVGTHDDGNHAGPRLWPTPWAASHQRSFRSPLFLLSHTSDEETRSLEVILHSQDARRILGHDL